MDNMLGHLWNKEKVIISIACAVFLVSFGYALCYRIRPAVDAWTYDQVGWNIAQGNGFRIDPSLPLEKDEVITYQGPVYQYFLGGVYAVFGHSYIAVWAIQSLLRALSAILIFLICLDIFGASAKRAGWWAAALFGFYPDLIEMNAMLMTETVFIFLMILSIYCFTRLYRTQGMWGVVWLSLSFAAAILARSSVIIFAPVFVWWMYRKKLWKEIVVFGFLMAVLLTPWAVRNYRVYHHFIPTMANFGYNFWVGNRLGADGEGGNPPELMQAIKDYGVIDANYYAFSQFKSFVQAHPFIYAKLTLSRALKYFSFIRPMGFWFYQTGWKQLLFVLSSASAAFILFSSGTAGIAYAWSKERGNRLFWYMAACAFLIFFSIVPILIETRYRLPIYPFFAIFGGYFIDRWLTAHAAARAYLWVGIGIVLAIGGVNFLIELPKVIDKIQGIFYS